MALFFEKSAGKQILSASFSLIYINVDSLSSNSFQNKFDQEKSFSIVSDVSGVNEVIIPNGNPGLKS